MEARQNDKTVIEVFSYAVVWWVLMGLSRVVGGGVGEGVSRRFVSSLFLSFSDPNLSGGLADEFILHPLDLRFQHVFHMWIHPPRFVFLPFAFIDECLFKDVGVENATTADGG